MLLLQGVTVVKDLDCQQRLNSLQTPIYGLIYFCGDYNLTLEGLDMQVRQLPYGYWQLLG